MRFSETQQKKLELALKHTCISPLFSSEEYLISADNFNWNLEEFSAANLNALNHAFSKCVDQKYINSFKSCYNKVAL